MKIEFIERAKSKLRRHWYMLQARAVNTAFPLYRDWLIQHDPWQGAENDPRRIVAVWLWENMSCANQEEVALRQTFLPPMEWDTSKQVDIEARIHGLPVVDPEQPMMTEPAREVLNPNGTSFKVVMKRAPTPEIPTPARTAKKRRTRKAA